MLNLLSQCDSGPFFMEDYGKKFTYFLKGIVTPANYPLGGWGVSPPRIQYPKSSPLVVMFIRSWASAVVILVKLALIVSEKIGFTFWVKTKKSEIIL